MKGRGWSVGLAAGGVVLALLASSFLGLSPCFMAGRSETVQLPSSEGGAPIERTVETYCSSLIESEGAGAIPVLIVPVLLAVGALVAAVFRVRVGVWIAAGLLLPLCVLAIFSIGIFYFPAAMALLAAAVIQQFEPRRQP